MHKFNLIKENPEFVNHPISGEKIVWIYSNGHVSGYRTTITVRRSYLNKSYFNARKVSPSIHVDN